MKVGFVFIVIIFWVLVLKTFLLCSNVCCCTYNYNVLVVVRTMKMLLVSEKGVSCLGMYCMPDKAMLSEQSEVEEATNLKT